MTVLEHALRSTTTGAVPATMRAAVYRGVNDVRLETVPVPAIGAGELLLRVHTCGICGTDLKKIHTGSHSAPRIFGHETSGVVAVVGDGVLDASDVGSAIASRALSAVIAGGVRVCLAAAGASEVAAYMLVYQGDRKLALQLIHAEFFGA